MNLVVSLRIPTGWWVAKNDFYDLSPEVLDGNLSPAGVFVQDILSIERWRGGTPVSPEQDFVLDLGWYPDGDPEGRYRLVLLRKNWDHVLQTFESRDRYAIQRTLDRWLELCNAATGLDQLVEQLQRE